jgi:hypothetical protein
LCADYWVAHTLGVACEAVDFMDNGLDEFRIGGVQFPKHCTESFDVALIEPEMPTGANRSTIRRRVALVSEIPDPDCTVSFCPAPAATPAFGTEARHELLVHLDGGRCKSAETSSRTGRPSPSVVV